MPKRKLDLLPAAPFQIMRPLAEGELHGYGRSSRIALCEPRPIWEGAGVQSDVRVKAADALRTAEKLALSANRKK